MYVFFFMFFVYVFPLCILIVQPAIIYVPCHVNAFCAVHGANVAPRMHYIYIYIVVA